jgi:hypothetical protein
VQYSSICRAISVTVRDLVVLWHTCEQKTRSELANRNQTQNTYTISPLGISMT